MSSKEKIIFHPRRVCFYRENVIILFRQCNPQLFIYKTKWEPQRCKSFHDMWSSWDLELQSAEITKVHKFELLGSNAAICVFTLGSKFTYKGTQNNDLPTVTSIFKNIGEKWKVAWRQRSSGQSDMALWNNYFIFPS